MILALLTLIAGLAISSVAIYYSVLGLAAIFAASVIPIMIMGTILELSKLVAAWWLKKNWSRAPFFLKSYMFMAVITLMFITSLGVFGFLSKAHVEQGVPTGDIVAQIEMIDSQISLETDIVEQSKASIATLDDQVKKYTELGYVTKGVNVRKEQEEERQFLNDAIRNSQTKIAELRRNKVPLSAGLRKVEAEVGPIKYIAQLIYGDNIDSTLLEKAVVWVIIVLVFVFDPLAVLLLLSAQLSFQWYRKERDEKLKQEVKEEVENKVNEFMLPNVQQTAIADEGPQDTEIEEEEDETDSEFQSKEPQQDEVKDEDVLPVEERAKFDELAYVEHTLETHPYLSKGIGNFPKLKPMVYHPESKPLTKDEAIQQTFDELLAMDAEELQEELDAAPPSPLGEAMAYAIMPEKNNEDQLILLTNDESTVIVNETVDTSDVGEQNEIVENISDVENATIHTNYTEVANYVEQSNIDTYINDDEVKELNGASESIVESEQEHVETKDLVVEALLGDDITQKDDIIETNIEKIENVHSVHLNESHTNIDSTIVNEEHITQDVLPTSDDQQYSEELDLKKKQERINWIERVSGKQVKRTTE